MVIFVHRPEYYHIYQDEAGHDLRGMAQIIIAKHTVREPPAMCCSPSVANTRDLRILRIAASAIGLLWMAVRSGARKSTERISIQSPQ